MVKMVGWQSIALVDNGRMLTQFGMVEDFYENVAGWK
jgi:hypothetical protein